MKTKILTALLLSIIIALASLFGTSVLTANAASAPLLDPLTIPKWVNQLTGAPPYYVPTEVMDENGTVIEHDYTVQMLRQVQQILPPGYPKTTVWGYGGMTNLGFVLNSPGPTFEAIKDIPVKVKWVNNIYSSHLFTVDPTLHWADPNNMGMMIMPPFRPYQAGYAMAQRPVPLVTHLHGGEDQSDFDGGPEQWWTWNGLRGKDYSTYEETDPNAAVFYYPNEQEATTLWYHDHALGITRLNVMSGLAGFYLLRDPDDTVAPLLPSGEYEVPIVIQDRIFQQNGQMFFPGDGVNPDVHPYWQPEFFGNTIMVNGLVWPNMNVDQGQYRFRFLEGSNARFYTLTFRVDGSFGNPALPFTIIGTDGGYLRTPVNATEFTFAPGQRVDILFDFSGFDPGTKIIIRNTANEPFPDGDPLNPDTVGQIMQFTVTNNDGPDAAVLPALLNPTLPAGPWPTLSAGSKTRMLPFFEEMSAIDEPLGVFLNGQKWAGPITELPAVGTTEDWWLINPTEDAHPIHTHLTQFQLVYRQQFNATEYQAAWEAENGPAPVPVDTIPEEVDVTPYLTGDPVYPTAEEMGWFDTIITPPGWVTVIRIRYASQDGTGYTFDATEGPGYVWHCHILEHEDNEMMRPYKVVNP